MECSKHSGKSYGSELDRKLDLLKDNVLGTMSCRTCKKDSIDYFNTQKEKVWKTVLK